MTIPEAVQLVIQAGALAEGGEVFVLDMGEPVKIVELAKSMIRLSGFKPDEDIEIVFTGLRPGEKLYEELLTHTEEVNHTKHKKIFAARVDRPDEYLLNNLLNTVRNAERVYSDSEVVRLLKNVVPEFRKKEEPSIIEVEKYKSHGAVPAIATN
jgi:FlaA1/EpsC-like NDP-sugar epimerase